MAKKPITSEKAAEDFKARTHTRSVLNVKLEIVTERNDCIDLQVAHSLQNLGTTIAALLRGESGKIMDGAILTAQQYGDHNVGNSANSATFEVEQRTALEREYKIVVGMAEQPSQDTVKQ